MKKRVIVTIGILIALSGCLTTVPKGAPAQPITEPIKLSDDATTSYDVSEVSDIHLVTPNEQTSALYNVSKQRVEEKFKSEGVNVSVTKQEEFDAPSENGTLTIYISTTTDTIPYVSNTVGENTDALDEDTAVIQSAIDQRGEDILIIHGGEWGVREATDFLIDEETITLGESLQTRVTATFSEYTGVYRQIGGERGYEVIQTQSNTEVVRYVSTETREEIALGDNVTVKARPSNAVVAPILTQTTTEYKSVPVIEIKTRSINDEVMNEVPENTTESNASTERELNTSAETINKTDEVNNTSNIDSQSDMNTTERNNITTNITMNEEVTNRSEGKSTATNSSTENTTDTSNGNTSSNAPSVNETRVSNSTSENGTNVNDTG